jgi:hypothetical protein
MLVARKFPTPVPGCEAIVNFTGLIIAVRIGIRLVDCTREEESVQLIVRMKEVRYGRGLVWRSGKWE